MPDPKPNGRRRPRSPQGQGGRLREELIAAADRILARTGDEEGLALRAVAREAGVAAPSIYLHFANKEELVEAVMLGHFAELRKALEEGVARADDPAAKLRAGCLAYCRFGLAHPGPYRVMFGPWTTAFPTTSWDEIPGADTFGLLVEGVAACMAHGVAPAGDPLRVATGVWAALHGVVSLRQPVPTFPWPPVEALVEDVVVGLVGVPPAGAEEPARPDARTAARGDAPPSSASPGA